MITRLSSNNLYTVILDSKGQQELSTCELASSFLTFLRDRSLLDRQHHTHMLIKWKHHTFYTQFRDICFILLSHVKKVALWEFDRHLSSRDLKWYTVRTTRPAFRSQMALVTVSVLNAEFYSWTLWANSCTHFPSSKMCINTLIKQENDKNAPLLESLTW